MLRWQQTTLNNFKLVMAARIYHVDLDYVLIEKICMRVVLAALAYNCGFGL